MFRNYLKTASRFLKQNKVFTAINALGLSIALAVSFIILLYIVNELSYDHCHRNRKQIYRVLNHYVEFNNTQSGTPFVLASTVKDEFPQVQKAVNTKRLHVFKLKLKEDFINIPNAIATESDVFDIFTIKLLEGHSDQNLLGDPNSIVISRDIADKFFPGENPIGKEIAGMIKNEEHTLIVNGVYENIPVNSTFRAQCFVNSKWTIDDINKSFGIANADKDWSMNFWNTWILLSKGNNAKSLENQIKEFNTKINGEKLVYQYSLQSLSDVYLKSDNINNSGIQGNIRNIRLFASIAFLIVIVAAINYILLSSAVSTGRAKEIGIRKTTGAANKFIRHQLLGESVLFTLIILPVALLLALIGLPFAGKLFQTNLHVINSNIPVYIPLYLILTILIGVASGIYTSNFLSRLKVIDILKKTTYTGKKRQYLRSSLIVIQLVIFCSFVSSTFIIRSQYQFALKKDPGYCNKDILLVDLGRDFKEYSAYINSFRANPDVIMAAGTMNALPTENSGLMMIPHFQDKNVKVQVEGLAIDYNFLKTMGIKITEGRDFSEDFGSDLTHSVIVNETAVKQLGITDPVGKMIGSQTIIGVVKDFNLHSIRTDIPPLLIDITDKFIMQVAIHYKQGKLDEILPFAKAEWKKITPDRPFSYSTIEELTKDIYSSEKNLSTIIFIFSLFALLIAALGLFGLTLFMAKTRTKEIGIKKVFGSSEQSIIYSFLRGNLLLVLVAASLSVPVTLLIMIKWLRNFAYRVNIDWWIFLIAFLSAAIVVFLTVSFQSYKASRVNPVISLRYE